MSETDPGKLGFIDGPTGHSLSQGVVVPGAYAHWPDNVKFTCGCGTEFTGSYTQKGGISKHTLVTYKRHIEAESADADDVFNVGTIFKPRVTWVVKVLNHRNKYAADYSASTRMKDWGTPAGGRWTSHYPWAVAIDKGAKGKTLDRLSLDRTSAIRKATDILDKATEEPNWTVVYADGVHAPAPLVVPTFRGTFSELLARTEEVRDSQDLYNIQSTVQELDEVLGLTGVLQTRRDELAAIYDQRTSGLLK